MRKINLLLHQFWLIFVHSVNLLSNLLGNDFLSCMLRRHLLKGLGNCLGAGTIIRGGGYVYGGKLTTGIHCQINRGCYFDFTEFVNLGDNVVIGHGVTFITATHDVCNSNRRAGVVLGRSITVENGVWIGANATILPGVIIGRGAIVAAGAVVTKNIDANVIVAGVPAHVIKELEATSDNAILA